MAANMKAVKLRIRSVQSTMQITKAMELVASSKLRKAKERAETCRPYFRELHETLQDIADGNTDFTSVYVKKAASEKYCYVVMAGDRGLAGGYNSNMFKTVEAAMEGRDCVVPVSYTHLIRLFLRFLHVLLILGLDGVRVRLGLLGLANLCVCQRSSFLEHLIDRLEQETLDQIHLNKQITNLRDKRPWHKTN